MKKNNLIKKILWIFLTGILCGFFYGCISTKMMDKAEHDRKHDIIKKIKSAYTDSAHNLIINFDAKLSQGSIGSYHIVTNMDTLLSYYLTNQTGNYYFPDSGAVKNHKCVRIKPNDLDNDILCIEFNRNIIDDDYLLPGSKSIHSLIVKSYSKKKKFKFLEKLSLNQNNTAFINARHLVFYFVPDSSLGLPGNFDDKTIVLSIEPSPIQSNRRTPLIIGAVVLDIATAVIQVFGFIKKIFK